MACCSRCVGAEWHNERDEFIFVAARYPISNLAVTWDPTRSKQMFKLIREDQTSDIGKNLCTKSGLPRQQ